jgi:predicted nucleotidyltransferase component of viral defense system
MQSLALLGLWRSKFFEQAAFYGGTALRILFGLDRFSEDLDFTLLEPSSGFNFNSYALSVQKELRAYGFEVTCDVKQKTADTNIISAFIKGNTLKQLQSMEAPSHVLSGINKNAIIKIKYVFTPVQYAVRSCTLPSLFAGKLHALLCRQWKTRVKGRDWYDFVWFVSHNPHLNLGHLENRMRQTGHYTNKTHLTLEMLIELLYSVIDKLDLVSAREEAFRFISDDRSLEIWSKDFFKAAVNQIKVEENK